MSILPVCWRNRRRSYPFPKFAPMIEGLQETPFRLPGKLPPPPPHVFPTQRKEPHGSTCTQLTAKRLSLPSLLKTWSANFIPGALVPGLSVSSSPSYFANFLSPPPSQQKKAKAERAKRGKPTHTGFFKKEKKCKSLTNPCLSEILLVSFSLWNVTTFDIHCSPVAGLSGWIYILFGISGSAFPATIHRELWNLYLQSSAATMSISKMYLAFLSSPVHRTLNGGNILLTDRQERRKRGDTRKAKSLVKQNSRFPEQFSCWFSCRIRLFSSGSPFPQYTF